MLPAKPPWAGTCLNLSAQFCLLDSWQIQRHTYYLLFILFTPLEKDSFSSCKMWLVAVTRSHESGVSLHFMSCCCNRPPGCIIVCFAMLHPTPHQLAAGLACPLLPHVDPEISCILLVNAGMVAERCLEVQAAFYLLPLPYMPPLPPAFPSSKEPSAQKTFLLHSASVPRGHIAGQALVLLLA